MERSLNSSGQAANAADDSVSLTRRHLLIGWWSLLSFASLGIWLEGMHAFKIGWYLDSAYTARRLMWTLGHAHGTLISLVHIAFAVTIAMLPVAVGRVSWASVLLTAAGLLLPGGFFLGGIFLYGGDPGLGVWLVPLGALLLLVSVALTAFAVSANAANGDEPSSDDAESETGPA